MSVLQTIWVAPSLSDGLGNRLFQYACAKNYSEKYSKKLVFFLPRSRRTGHGRFDTIFKLFPDVEVLETDISWNEIEENNYYAFEELPKLRENVVIKGSRQNYKYFKDTTITPSFERVISEERLKYLNLRYLKDKENLFFIHVRLGDYRNLPHYQIDIAKYYSEALKLIPIRAKLLIFSDEPDVAKQIFSEVEICEETDEVETLYLMSNCLLGAVVVNSTFSYWGSYFAHKKSKSYTAIFPYKLMTRDYDYSEYFPEYATVLKF